MASAAHSRQKQWIPAVLMVIVFMGVAVVAHGSDVPTAIRKLVEKDFPGAAITELRKDMWQGQPVTEVEFISTDGVEYEMIVSGDGKVLNIDEENGLPWLGGELIFGLGVMVEKDLYKGVDTEVQPVPFFNYENGPFQIMAYQGIDVTYALYRTDHFSIAAGGYFEVDAGYDPDDSDYLKGMKELDYLYGAGLYLQREWAGWGVGLEILQDLSGENDGQQAELSLVYPWFVEQFEIRPKLSLAWLSEKTVDYLFGVSAEEARVDRPAYSPGASYEIELGLLIQRPIVGDFSAVGLFEISTYGNEITDSPLVDQDYSWEGVIGVMYAF